MPPPPCMGLSRDTCSQHPAWLGRLHGPLRALQSCLWGSKKGPTKGAPGSLTETFMGADAQPLKAAFGNNGSGGGFPVQGPSVRATTASRGGVGRGGWEPPHSAAAPTYLGGEEQKCQSSSLFARCLGLLSSPSFGVMLLRAGKGSLGAQVRLLASRTPLSLQPRLRKKLCCVKCIFLSVSAGKKTCFAIALMVRKSMTDKERI